MLQLFLTFTIWNSIINPFWILTPEISSHDAAFKICHGRPLKIAFENQSFHQHRPYHLLVIFLLHSKPTFSLWKLPFSVGSSPHSFACLTKSYIIFFKIYQKLSEVRLFHSFKIDCFMNIAPILTPTPTPTHPDPVLTTTELTWRACAEFTAFSLT